MARRAPEARLGMTAPPVPAGNPHYRRSNGGGRWRAGSRPRAADALPDVPVWRAPPSQHLGYLAWHAAGHGAEAEAAAQGDRAARPVRLDDYYFLRELDGEAGRRTGRGDDDGARARLEACWVGWCCARGDRQSSGDVDLA